MDSENRDFKPLAVCRVNKTVNHITSHNSEFNWTMTALCGKPAEATGDDRV